MNRDLSSLRTDYQLQSLEEKDTPTLPFDLFKRWMEDSLKANISEANAMTLSTASPQGRPSSRIVLLKDLDERGFVFYTNYLSKKGNEIKQNPLGALNFFWKELERQVRIEGRLEQVSAEESEAYFRSRPADSQIGANVSPQSQVISGREVLEEQVKEWQKKYKDTSVPRPLHWGGYRLIPDYMEFWQGRPNRLHDRIAYQLNEAGAWEKKRLAP